MTGFTLHLQSIRQCEDITEVDSFVAEDETGSFGLKANHANFISALSFGLARYRRVNEDWEYLAIPGGLIHFQQNQCYLITRSYVRSADYSSISRALTEQLKTDEENLQQLKNSLQNLEQEMIRRIWDMRRRGAAFL